MDTRGETQYDNTILKKQFLDLLFKEKYISQEIYYQSKRLLEEEKDGINK